jgi:hypothetical protein
VPGTLAKAVSERSAVTTTSGMATGPAVSARTFPAATSINKTPAHRIPHSIMIVLLE